MEIRRAIESDVPVLASLNAHVHDLHVRAEPDFYRRTSPADVEARFSEVLADEATRALLAVVRSDAVGYVVARVVRHPGHAFVLPHAYLLVDQIAVEPSTRRCGVGTMLMEAVHDLVRQEGLHGVELDVRSHNRVASMFYEALGYTSVQSRMRRQL